MRKSYILVPLLVGILMVSAFHTPVASATTITDIQAQIQSLLKIVQQLSLQLLQVLKGRGVVPAPPVVGQCGWCGVSCQRIRGGMYCPQITPPAGYECKDINGVCTKVVSTTSTTSTTILPNTACIDTDGGINDYVKGTVTYYGKKYTDGCSHYFSKVITEYYCDNGRVKSETHSCPPDYTCQDGVCKSVPTPPTCIDTDGGENYYVKGTVTYNGKKYTDECDPRYTHCIRSRVKSGGGSVDGHASMPYTICGAVKEYYCENGAVKSKTRICGSCHRCQDGACSGVSVCNHNGICEGYYGENSCVCPSDCSKEPSCTDSDGGKNYYVKGTVTFESNDGSKTYTDECSSSSNLMEFYCKNKIVQSQQITCPSGYTCQDGACK